MKAKTAPQAAFAALALISLAGCVASSPERDQILLDRFVCAIEGSWDNVQQARADIESGVSEADRHPRRAMTYVPIDALAIEGQLFAIKSYGADGLSGEISRVALHRFRQHDDHLIHEFLFLKHKDRWGDLASDLTALARLKERDVTINTRCAMQWRLHDGYFEGSTTEGLCVTSSFTPQPIRVEGHGELWPEKLVRHDRNYSLAGDPLPVQGGHSPEVFDRLAGPALHCWGATPISLRAAPQNQL